MKLRKLSIYLFVFLSPVVVLGQVEISEYIQTSKLSKTENNSLYFIDFWATWCGPCIHVAQYLEILQKQYPNDFYVVSLTKENPEVVKRFIKKHKTRLAVAIDFDGETFRKHKISNLPYGVLYNAKGKKLWEGHPAEFKKSHVKRFLKNNDTKRISIDKMFKISVYSKETLKEGDMLKKDFEFLKLIKDQDFNSMQVLRERNFLELKGSLQDILAYTLHVHKKQIDISDDLNKFYQMRFKLDTNAFFNKAETIMEALTISKEAIKEKGEALVFNIEKPTFWDSRQIDWGSENSHFLIGDTDIQADNVSLSQIKYQLANLLETPIVIKNYEDDSKLHDWQIHYKYFDLMVSSMNDNYGIKTQKKTTSYIKYLITKKAP